MHPEKIILNGIPAKEAGKALIMLHGRGGSSNSMLLLKESLNTEGFHIIIPQATGNEWYPFTYLSPPQRNEPWLSHSFNMLTGIIRELNREGIPDSSIWFLGFSQGACLALEYTARNARRYGGMIAFSGGLIGDRLYPENYSGNFEGTPVFMSSSEEDPHVPHERFIKSAELINEMHADLTMCLYPGSSHHVSREETDTVNERFFLNQGNNV